MEPTIDTEALIQAIRQEHRSTRIVFGISIIVLALVLMVVAPSVIRTLIQDKPDASDAMMITKHGGPAVPAMASTTTSTATTTATTTGAH